MSNDTSVGDRAIEVLSRVPAGMFEIQAFVDQAATPKPGPGPDELWEMFKYLIDSHTIQRPPGTVGKRALWVRCAECRPSLDRAGRVAQYAV